MILPTLHYKTNLEVPTMKFTSTTLSSIRSKKGRPMLATIHGKPGASTPTRPQSLWGQSFYPVPLHGSASSPVARKKSLSKLDRPRILKRAVADCHVSTLPPPPKLRRAVARSFERSDDVDEPDYTMYDMVFPEGGRGYVFNTKDGDCKCARTHVDTREVLARRHLLLHPHPRRRPWW